MHASSLHTICFRFEGMGLLSSAAAVLLLKGILLGTITKSEYRGTSTRYAYQVVRTILIQFSPVQFGPVRPSRCPTLTRMLLCCPRCTVLTGGWMDTHITARTQDVVHMAHMAHMPHMAQHPTVSLLMFLISVISGGGKNSVHRTDAQAVQSSRPYLSTNQFFSMT